MHPDTTNTLSHGFYKGYLIWPLASGDYEISVNDYSICVAASVGDARRIIDAFNQTTEINPCPPVNI